MLNCLRTFVLVILAVGLPASAIADFCGKDDRYLCNDKKDWDKLVERYGNFTANRVRNSVYRLENGCSGVAISPRYFLSAGHCWFYGFIRKDLPLDDVIRAHVVDPGRQDVRLKRVIGIFDEIPRDILLLERIDGRFIDFIPGDFSAGSTEVLPGDEFLVAGFPVGGQREWWAGPFANLYVRLTRGRLFVSPVTGPPIRLSAFAFYRQVALDNPIRRFFEDDWVLSNKYGVYKDEGLCTKCDAHSGNSGSPVIRIRPTDHGPELYVIANLTRSEPNVSASVYNTWATPVVILREEIRSLGLRFEGLDIY